MSWSESSVQRFDICFSNNGMHWLSQSRDTMERPASCSLSSLGSSVSRQPSSSILTSSLSLHSLELENNKQDRVRED